MKSFLSLNIKIIVLLFLSSCEKYVDTVPPVVDWFTINENDGSGEVMIDTLSTELEYRAYFRDVGGMLSYSITYESKDNDGPGLRVPAFLNTIDTFAIGGAQSETYTKTTIFGGDNSEGYYVAATGLYDIHLDYRDLALNDGSRVTIPIELRNYAPFFKYQDFEEDSVNGTTTSIFNIRVTVDDLDNNLNACNMIMYSKVYEPDSIETDGIVYDSLLEYTLTQPVPGAGPYQINETFDFDSVGIYELRLSSSDDKRNITNSIITIGVPK
ncbi:hypothetical protein [Flammeovirga kamogawensis]|uniref:DUF4625 domain-containing protein n=1 Tax=Flammeovirga kamogawensis TaxID=373891 RepID=A0ABX8GS36_9BACT|nr:hypothetical protein [Flammeovirga kamogawensis]MBB6463733.1 hypothetical protein [Flammeovirga kamogawensis]QWG06229.1 hypothetical protein KM029_12865 [Flammeovirga kamogawensis]TRX68062.1 hypothetical protein EO216_07890 [Flammeovirga kamogawensis]